MITPNDLHIGASITAGVDLSVVSLMLTGILHLDQHKNVDIDIFI